MEPIHQLSSILSDQISAGEVIERPASVVKELIENSIDAGSTRIDIELTDAGLNSIRITDNGSGIAPDQVQLAFKRFATSKIKAQADLFAVHSLGFRGEALPSIASISEVTMKTSDGEHEGSEIQIQGGKVIQQKPAAIRRGTMVEVCNLFFNTPNRLKYLKSNATELSKITDIVNRLALSHPEVAFSLSHNQRELLRTSGRNNIQQVIAGIYGNSSMKKMIAVENENEKFKITGYTSLPELTRASRKYISVIINGRFIKDYTLNHAIIEGYGSKLMVGRYPVSVIKVTMDPHLIDVNVHPTKQEIRVLDNQALCDFIAKSIYATLAEQNLIPNALDNQAIKRQNTGQQPLETSLAFDDKADLNESNATTLSVSPSVSETSQVIEHTSLQTPPSAPIIVKTKTDLHDVKVKKFQDYYLNERVDTPLGDEVKPSQPVEKERFPHLSFIGQVHGTYLIAESQAGMYIVDQHAAQERINYEKLRRQVGEVSADEQNLLVPIVLDYPASDALIIKSHLDLLESVGLKLESFGHNSFVIHQHPTWFEKGQEEVTIKAMIDWVLNNDKLTTAAFREKAAIMASCKQAIKANHHLDRQQAQALLDTLQNCENPFNCPHGRPVLVHFSPSDLETMFKRIQDPHEASGWE